MCVSVKPLSIFTDVLYIHGVVYMHALLTLFYIDFYIIIQKHFYVYTVLCIMCSISCFICISSITYLLFLITYTYVCLSLQLNSVLIYHNFYTFVLF